MMPNLDPKQMEKLMRQMGIDSKEIEAKRVVIEGEGRNIVVNEPKVVEVTMQGQKSYQVSGSVSVESAIGEDDVKMIMEQAGVPREKAAEALKKANGNIAEAILILKS